MDILTWLDNSEQFQLTIKDILDIPLNKPVLIFCMDRNVIDLCDKSTTPLAPSFFFRKNYFFFFTRTEGIIGNWEWTFNKKRIDIEKEFDINLDTCWYPLKDNQVPDKDEQCLFDFGEMAGKSYTDFPPNTKVGWRGPMMMADDMNKLPFVYNKQKHKI